MSCMYNYGPICFWYSVDGKEHKGSPADLDAYDRAEERRLARAAAAMREAFAPLIADAKKQAPEPDATQPVPSSILGAHSPGLSMRRGYSYAKHNIFWCAF